MDLVFRQTLIVLIVGMVVPIGLICFTSLLASIVQAVTQVQEQTLGFFIKLITLIVLLYLTWDLIEKQVLQLTIQSIDAMGRVK